MIGKTFAAGSNTFRSFGRRDGENQRQVSRFLLIGFASVGVDFGCFQLLLACGLPSPVAKGLSYVAGMLLGYVGNKYWTFRSERRSVAEPVNYLVLYATTLAVNVAAHTAIMRIAGPSGAAFAYLAATGLTTVLNFIGLKWFAFRVGVQQRQARQTA